MSGGSLCPHCAEQAAIAAAAEQERVRALRIEEARRRWADPVWGALERAADEEEHRARQRERLRSA